MPRRRKKQGGGKPILTPKRIDTPVFVPKVYDTQQGIVDLSVLTTPLTTGGAKGFTTVGVRQTQTEGRLCVALNDVKEGAELLRIPHSSCLIHLDQFDELSEVIQHPNLKISEEYDEDDVKMFKRVLLLLHARSQPIESFWTVYMNTLPTLTDFQSHMPLFWTSEQLDRCGPASVVPAMIKRLKKQVQSTFF